MAPAIGDRIHLRKILEEERKVTERVIIKPKFCYILQKQTDNSDSFLNGLEESQRTEVSIEDQERAGALASSLPSTSSNISTTPLLTSPIPAQSEWHLAFVIPELRTFSDHVKEAVATGVISSRARREIIQVLRTYMTAYTVKPKSEQYKTICKKLILKFPKLEDTEGKGDYVSVMRQLSNVVYCPFLTNRDRGNWH